MISQINWTVFSGQIALGTLIGVAVGFTIKKSFKLFLIILGSASLFLIFLEQMEFITISWQNIESWYTALMEDSGGFQNILNHFIQWIASRLHVGGSFAAGFLVGFKLG